MSHPQHGFFSPEVQQNPYPFYKRLRHDAPVTNLPGFGWIVSRYDPVKAILSHPEVFSSSVMASADPVLLGSDPPQHTRHRAIVNRVFSSERVKSLEASIRSLADLLADRIQNMPRWDLMADLAQPLPIMLIAEILGIPGDRHQQFKSWANSVVTGAGSMGAQSRAGEDIQDIDLFLREIIESRQVRPGHDLISQLMAGTGEDNVLTPSQVLSFSKLLIVAGSETTTNLIGNAVLALFRNPTEFDKLQDNPAMLPGAIEEALRYDSPVQFVMRKTTQGATLLGHDLPAGAHVIALIGSANRDESRFADAEVFDIGRKPQANLVFGLGPHYCLGPVLARMEAQIVLERFLPIISKCRAAGDLSNIPRVQSIQVRGPRALPLIRSDL